MAMQWLTLHTYIYIHCPHSPQPQMPQPHLTIFKPLTAPFLVNFLTHCLSLTGDKYMAPNKKSDDGSANNKQVIIRSDKGAWTAEEDRKLSEYIETHGAKRWKTIATKSGLNRCGKSCRLRWLNYLRPNIKRGNISDEEEDLILRLHKLLGNRWALIAGRLPGRTDNEIKNYWNSHLSKKISHEKKISRPSAITEKASNITQVKEEEGAKEFANSGLNLDIDIDDFFDFSTEGCYGLDWVNKFPELDDLDSSSWLTDKR